MVGWNLRDWPELTEEIYAEQERINDRFLRVGVTTVTGHASGYTVTIMSQLFHQDRLKMRIRPDVDFARQNPMADQFIRRTPNLVNFSLGDGMVRIVGAAVGPVDGASDDGSILTNQPKLRVHPEVGGTHVRHATSGRARRSPAGTGPTSRSTSARRPKRARCSCCGSHGWNIGGNHNMGSQAATIVLADTARRRKAAGHQGAQDVLGRNALDHNLIWDAKSIELARALGDRVAFGLNSELWSPRIVRGEEMLFAQYGERLSNIQPVRDLVKAGVHVHFEGGKPDEPPLWRIERFVTRVDRYQTRSERGRQRSQCGTRP